MADSTTQPAHSENESVRTISRWECPGCGKPFAGGECRCSYSGGGVEVWYVEKGAYLAALERATVANTALFECAKESGADVSDGAPGWPPLEVWAVEEVKRMRADFEENDRA